MLRRLRFQLFSHLLRFPIPHFRRTSQGEVIAMITAEVEPLGGFIGDAVALPAFQGGTLLTILFFMFMQDWILGLAAIALYPLQVYLIPKLQRQVNALSKERVRTVRRLSENIGESVSGITEIHANDTSEWHRALFSRWVGIIYDIRLRIYRKKFFIKFLNNFIAQLTPFFFYSIGGYLVIRGQLSFGSLVAVLAAYKDLASPWKELLDWYQQKEDSRIKYEQLVEQFRPEDMFAEEAQARPETEPPHLAGPVVASRIAYHDEGGIRILEDVSVTFDLSKKVAIVGDSGSGADTLARLLARLITPTAGTLQFGGMPLSQLPEWVTGRRISYVDPEVVLLTATIRDNLLYTLKRQPLGRPDGESEERAAAVARWQAEARRAGNTESDTGAEWIDLATAGVADGDGLRLRISELLQAVDLEEDMLQFGLRLTLDLAERAELASAVLQARQRLRERLRDAQFADLVEPFDPDRYNTNLSVADNILFGMPVGPAFDTEHIAEHPYIRAMFEDLDLTTEFEQLGFRVAKLMVDLFQGLPPGHELYDRFNFFSPDQLPDMQALVRRVEGVGLDNADAADRRVLISLPFKIVVARQRLGLIDEAMQQRLLKARKAFMISLPAALRPCIAFFDPAAYNPAASLQDNILFGRVAYGKAQAQRRIGALLAEVIEDLGLRRAIADLGLDYDAGIGGSRLSAVQRQKIGLARGLLKRPDLLILNHSLAALDPVSRDGVLDRVLAVAGDTGVVCVVSPADDRSRFDRTIMMEAGRVVDPDAGTEPQVPRRPGQGRGDS
jgi:ABC-type multidrug transport system fused ATPase/permease subunit